MGTEVGTDRSLDEHSSSSSSSSSDAVPAPPVVTQPGALPAARVPQRAGVPRTFAAAFADQGQPHLHVRAHGRTLGRT
jgi:hypothetical protein